jgi:hypothetical protein
LEERGGLVVEAVGLETEETGARCQCGWDSTVTRGGVGVPGRRWTAASRGLVSGWARHVDIDVDVVVVNIK